MQTKFIGRCGMDDKRSNFWRSDLQKINIATDLDLEPFRTIFCPKNITKQKHILV